MSDLDLNQAKLKEFMRLKPTKDDTPEVKRFREELKDLKAKVDAMIVGGRIRG